MKEPILVNLIISLNSENQFHVQFPLKKINQMCTITKERLLRFLINHKFIQKEDEEKIYFGISPNYLEFFDFISQIYVPEKKVFVQSSNWFEFSESFLGSPNELTLKIALFYNFNYSKLREIEQAIELFEKEKQSMQIQQDSIKESFEQQKTFFFEMKSDMAEIKERMQQSIIQAQYDCVDMVILYSNPLLRVNEGLQEALYVDYGSEIDQIVRAIEKSSRPISYKIMQATRSNLEKAIEYHPLIIHVVSHGDYDPKSGYFFLEFQEDGISRKFTTNEFQNIIKSNKGFQKTKLICLSSIISQHFVDYLAPIIYEIKVVGYQKFYNNHDVLCQQFWGKFYEELFFENSVDQSFEQANKDILQTFWEQKELQKICCCFHKHHDYCPLDPTIIGYEQSHQKHLPCQIQIFFHNCKVYKKDSQEQCDSSCLGQIRHIVRNNICLQNEDIESCQSYEERIDLLWQSLSQEITDCQRLDLNSSLSYPLSKAKLGCCCDQIKQIYESINEPQCFDSKWQQHTIDLKSFKFSPLPQKQGESLMSMISQVQAVDEKEQYISLDKQIIIVHSKSNLEGEQFSVVQSKLIAYFNVKNCLTQSFYNVFYSNKVMKLHELNFQACQKQHWKEYVASQFNLENGSDETFFQNLATYLMSYNSKPDLYNIMMVQQIDKIYDQELFAKFYDHLQTLIHSHFILILTVNNIIKDKLKDLTRGKLIQLIDIDTIASMLEENKQQKQQIG